MAANNNNNNNNNNNAGVPDPEPDEKFFPYVLKRIYVSGLGHPRAYVFRGEGKQLKQIYAVNVNREQEEDKVMAALLEVDPNWTWDNDAAVIAANPGHQHWTAYVTNYMNMILESEGTLDNFPTYFMVSPGWNATYLIAGKNQ